MIAVLSLLKRLSCINMVDYYYYYYLSTAPEVINGEPVSLGTDLWSVGVIIYVLLSGVSPFYSDNYERSCQNITEIRYRFPHEFFSGVSTEATDLIEELLIHDQRLVNQKSSYALQR